MKLAVKDVKLSESEMKEIKGGDVNKYYCLHNGSVGIFLYNNESGQWRDLVGNQVSTNNLMNCGDCDPRIHTPN